MPTAKMPHVTAGSFAEDSGRYSKMCHASIKLARQPEKLSVAPLGVGSLRTRVYADASFGVNGDGSSQVGYTCY